MSLSWYKHDIAACEREMAGLSLEQRGAYRTILDHYYALAGELPPDLEPLQRLCGAITPRDKEAVQQVADRFFPVNGDGTRHHERALDEIRKRMAAGEAHRRVGKANKRTINTSNSTIISFDFDSCKFDGITESDRLRWQEAYPGISVSDQIDRAALWLHANPSKRKSNYERFLTNWLGRAQDRGR